MRACTAAHCTFKGLRCCVPIPPPSIRQSTRSNSPVSVRETTGELGNFDPALTGRTTERFQTNANAFGKAGRPSPHGVFDKNSAYDFRLSLGEFSLMRKLNFQAAQQIPASESVYSDNRPSLRPDISHGPHWP